MTPNKEDKKLKFRAGNAKLAKDIFTFSLPSGYTCPGAKDCLARADVETGKITDGPHQKFRCFSATDETRPSVRKARWYNFQLLTACKTTTKMVDLIENSLPPQAFKIRIHVAGDFFSQAYFDAWLMVAEAHPEITFYAYTKSIHFVRERWAEVQATANFRLTSSDGGKFDHYAAELGMIQATVVMHPSEAEDKGLEIDKDDSHAMVNTHSFALLLHSTQPKGTEAAAHMKQMRDGNIDSSYSLKNKK
jgi:hypothetical protein